MKANLRATALLGSSSFVSIIAAAAMAKFYAIRIDADGIGLSALMQSVIGLATMFSAVGIPVGLTREVASAAQRNDADEQGSALAAAQHIVLIGNVIVFGGVVVFWPHIARVALGNAHVHWWEVLALAAAGTLSTWSAIQTAYLNGHQKLAALARFAIISSLMSAAAGVALVWLLGVSGIAPGIFATALIGAVLARTSIVRQHLPRQWVAPLVSAARSRLVRFGLPLVLSNLLGSGLQYVLPILVLRMLDRSSVGIYRAASAISVTYVGILITTMSQEYYPRISAAPKAMLKELLDDQHRLVLIVGVPIICMGAVLSPLVIPVLYKTDRFTAAVPVLQWQLIGDLLRLSSWTMSYIILARSGSFAYFVMETISAIIFFAMSWLGMHFLGITGMGMGFLASYALYWCVAAVVLRRTLGISLSGRNVGTIACVVLALVVLQLLPQSIPAVLRAGLRGLFSLVVTSFCSRLVWQEFRRRTPVPTGGASG